MGMASLSSKHHCSPPILYSDKVSLGESELQLSVTNPHTDMHTDTHV